MKHITRIVLVVSLFCAFIGSISCTKESEPTVEYLEVNANNISGCWELVSWKDSPLAEGAYVYIEFVRKDTKFDLYQNLDSFSARHLTGRFAIYEDEVCGPVIRGEYDYGIGEWGHRYSVSLTADKMVWTALDNPEDVSVYSRCSEIPVK